MRNFVLVKGYNFIILLGVKIMSLSSICHSKAYILSTKGQYDKEWEREIGKEQRRRVRKKDKFGRRKIYFDCESN